MALQLICWCCKAVLGVPARFLRGVFSCDCEIQHSAVCVTCMRDRFLNPVIETRDTSVLKCPTCTKPFRIYDVTYGINKRDLYEDDHELAKQLDSLVGMWSCPRCHEFTFRNEKAWEHHIAVGCSVMVAKYGLGSFLAIKHLENRMLCSLCTPKPLAQQHIIPKSPSLYSCLRGEVFNHVDHPCCSPNFCGSEDSDYSGDSDDSNGSNDSLRRDVRLSRFRFGPFDWLKQIDISKEPEGYDQTHPEDNPSSVFDNMSYCGLSDDELYTKEDVIKMQISCSKHEEKTQPVGSKFGIVTQNQKRMQTRLHKKKAVKIAVVIRSPGLKSGVLKECYSSKKQTHKQPPKKLLRKRARMERCLLGRELADVNYPQEEDVSEVDEN